MATARVATTIREKGQQASYSSGDPCGRHASAGRREHCYSGDGAPLVATHTSHYNAGSDFPVAGNCARAHTEHETVATGRGTQEFSGHLEQGALAQYADAA